MKKTTLLLVIVLLAGIVTLGAQTRPEDLRFSPLSFTPPDPLTFKTTFAHGLRGYLQEDHSLPLVEITAVVPYGSLYDSREKTGLAKLLQTSLVKGGTTKMDGAALEERLDFLGASLNFRVNEQYSTLTLSLLSKDLQEGLGIFFDLLRNPAFRNGSLDIAKSRLIEELKQANDSPKPVLEREYSKVLYGDHPLAWQPNKKTVESVTVEDLKAVVAKYFVPGNIVIAGSGDFRRPELVEWINRFTSGWKGAKSARLDFTTSFAAAEPGVYFVQKKINQGYVNLGHLGITESNPDFFAVQVMNFILGGGSFTSRITTKVRSDEGLAYNTGSRFSSGWGFPGLFAGYVQTKSSTVGYAISLIKKEFERIRNEEVSNGEMDTAINYFLESFSEQFTTPSRTMLLFATYEILGKPMDEIKNYAATIKKIDKAKVQEVAKKYINPDKLVVFIVGDWDGCNKGSEKYSQPLESFGRVHRVELSDPMNP